jgi:hypothetical protein
MQNPVSNMVKTIFQIVANSLYCAANKTGRTYNQINVIFYYFFIPFTWLLLLDLLLNFHYLKISFGIFLLGFSFGCRDFKAYSDWLFDRSVSFLLYFNKYGSNYVASSVWICVSLPLLIYALLFFMLLK